ncbi:MAG TPA: class II fructose-bisphosphate aldolase [Candidatus Acidoferrales bacterium]|nr:class II fructose-bisphosphate aldolase [Candidatus Acidoferrales bacterium]
MLAHGPELLRRAHAEGRAVPAMTTYTLESTRAICDAAEAVGSPVILQAGASSFHGVGRELLAAVALTAARCASVPVGVHLDHSTNLGEIRWCIEIGYTSVMIDGSRLPYSENIAVTQAVVREAHDAGVWVEAEIGAIAGDEDSSTDSASAELTDPVAAADFADRTGVDALAVGIGTVHGFSATPVQVDFSRLSAIAALVSVPLVLHGTSGLEDEDVLRVVRSGVAKVNINADLRRAYIMALGAATAGGGDDILRVQQRAVAAVAQVATAKLKLLAGLQRESLDRAQGPLDLLV